MPNAVNQPSPKKILSAKITAPKRNCHSLKKNPMEPIHIHHIGRHFNYEWSFVVYPIFSNDKKLIGIGSKVVCTNTLDEPTWSINTKVFTIVHEISRPMSSLLLDMEFNQDCTEMNRSSKNVHIPKSLQQLYALGQVPARVGVEIEDTVRKFDDPTHSDITLIAGQDRFHVSKAFLSSQCGYFRGLYSNKYSDSDKKELTLPVHPLHFQHFLEVLMGERSVTEQNVMDLLNFAHYYNAPTATRACFEFLIDNSLMTEKELYTVSIQYATGERNELKEELFSRMESANDLKTLLPEDLKEIPKNNMIELLQLSLKLNQKDLISTRRGSSPVSSMNRLADQWARE